MQRLDLALVVVEQLPHSLAEKGAAKGTLFSLGNRTR
jgi:hypothetical protein